MKAKLGMSPIAWWNDDLAELSDDVSLEECLRQSRSAGFTGMEMGRRFPERSRGDAADPAAGRRDALRRLVLRHAGRRGARGEQGPHPADDRAVQGRERALHRLWRGRPLHPGRPLASRSPTKPQALRRRDEGLCAGSVTEFGEWCAEQGMPLAYHHHMAAVVETEPELDAFMQLFGRRHSAAARCRPSGLCRRRRAARHRQPPRAHHAMCMSRTCAWR